LNNKLSGRTFDYDSLGNLSKTLDYRDGKLNGYEIDYYPDGKIQELSPLRNDSAYGFCYEFDEHGDTLDANVHYGVTIDGVFTKKWLANKVIVEGYYGDKARTFVRWKWIDRNGKVLKTKVDKGVIVNSTVKKFVIPR
jgi:antitoxin component YwqK of YwqJK toxin-antitoxin module